MVATKRQRIPHFIAGLGDGNVHEQPRITNDDIFPPSQRLTPYIRKRPTPTQQKVLPSPRAIFTKDTFSDSGDPTSTDGPWQISAMALLCLMGLLVGLFLHLVTDSAEKQQFPRRVRARTHSSPTKKKKTDEWSEDEEEVEGDAYRADSEAHPLYYPYRYANQQHRHRAASCNSGTLHHRMPSTATYKGPSSSRHAAATSQSPGPTLRTTRSTDSGTVLSSRGTRPVIEDVQPTEEDLLNSPFRRAQSLHPCPLSPVSSFASMENHSSGMDTHTTHEGDEETGASPIVIANAVSFDALQQSSSRLLNKGTEDNFHDFETPRAGTHKRHPAILDQSESYATNLLPPPPLHEERQFLLPYIPDLAAHHSWIEEVSVPASEPQAAYPGHIHPLPQQITPHHPASAPASNDPRKNIIHKREDITHFTDAESSLMKSSVDFAEISLDCVIGGGGFGQVWKATWRSTPVAVKILTGSAQRENCDYGLLQEFAAEINMLKGMRHPNICLYMGACLTPPNRAIITELAANGSLWDALRLPLSAPYSVSDGTNRESWPLSLYSDQMSHVNPPLPPKGTWPWVLVKRVACGAARGMTYLHSGTPPVLHRDLKSANLLLDDSYTAKVCDFGLSRLKAQERSMTGNCGTVQWMAPEVLANQRYAEPADIYSFGIILWEMLTGECPYEGMSAIQCALSVLNRDHRPDIPQWCPPALSALIQACWEKNPGKRPSFAQIIMALDAMP